MLSICSGHSVTYATVTDPMFCDPYRGRTASLMLSGGIAPLNPRLPIFEPSGFIFWQSTT